MLLSSSWRRGDERPRSLAAAADAARVLAAGDAPRRFLDLARDPVRVQSFDFIFRSVRAEQHVSIVVTVLTPARARVQFHMAFVRRAILAA
ncbi:hypothetical protein [Sorangium sp. So ce1153]|uniref:hypothetical protein n=1 Tax=Sorangium sp. So ce1153 TaxID=3133333 RepID=UPI003F5EADE9